MAGTATGVGTVGKDAIDADDGVAEVIVAARANSWMVAKRSAA